MKRREDLDNKDHVFAKWLREHDWKDYAVDEDGNKYYDSTGLLIATAIFDNVKCTYVVCTNED